MRFCVHSYGLLLCLLFISLLNLFFRVAFLLWGLWRECRIWHDSNVVNRIMWNCQNVFLWHAFLEILVTKFLSYQLFKTKIQHMAGIYLFSFCVRLSLHKNYPNWLSEEIPINSINRFIFLLLSTSSEYKDDRHLMISD